MSSILDVSGNNLPEITLTTSVKEVLSVCQQLVSRKKNSFPGYVGDGDASASGYNRAIVELEEELDRLILKLDSDKDVIRL